MLEVGSGNRPLVRSDILCDKFPFSSYERSGYASIVIDRPFVAADATYLPFKDKSIDFLFCTDLAEHLEQPHKFFDECMRVAYKGAIITPSILSERLFGWDYHTAMYEILDGKLIIHQKTDKNWGWFGETFHQLCKDDKNFNRLVKKRTRLFRMIYEWEDKIQYEYALSRNNEDEKWHKSSSADQIVEQPPGGIESAKRMLKSILSHLLRKYLLRREDIDLKSILCCPACHGELTYKAVGSAIECTSCGRIYNIKNNIPLLILNE